MKELSRILRELAMCLPSIVYNAVSPRFILREGCKSSVFSAQVLLKHRSFERGSRLKFHFLIRIKLRGVTRRCFVRCFAFPRGNFYSIKLFSMARLMILLTAIIFANVAREALFR